MPKRLETGVNPDFASSTPPGEKFECDPERRQLRWEYLRRNRAYRKEFDELGKHPHREIDEEICMEFAQRWSISNPYDYRKKTLGKGVEIGLRLDLVGSSNSLLKIKMLFDLAYKRFKLLNDIYPEARLAVIVMPSIARLPSNQAINGFVKKLRQSHAQKGKLHKPVNFKLTTLDCQKCLQALELYEKNGKNIRTTTKRFFRKKSIEGADTRQLRNLISKAKSLIEMAPHIFPET